MGHSTTGRHGASNAGSRRNGGSRLLAVVLVAAAAVLGVARPAAAAPGLTGSVGGPSATAFGRTVSFTGMVTNTGRLAEDDFSSVSITDTGSVGLAVTSVTPVGFVPAGGTAGFAVSARILGTPGSMAQLRLWATGITNSSTVADPSIPIVGGSFAVTEAVVLTVTAERSAGGSSSPCPATSCSVSIDDGLRYSVTVANVGGASATVSVSAPTPANTAPIGMTTIPTDPVIIGAGTSRTFTREVTVNDPANDSDPPQPGTIIGFTATATYRIDSPPLASRPAEGSPATLLAEVVDPRLVITNEMTDTNGGQLAGGDPVESTVRIQNTGNANATNTVLAVTVTNLQNPTNVRIDGAAAPAAQVTVAGDTLTVRVGTGASGTSGGSVAPGAVVVVGFSATAVTSPSDAPPTAGSTASVSFDNGGLSPKTASATPLPISVTHLRLLKKVVNDDGGTAGAADFTLSASGPTTISGPGSAEADVNPGTYTLSESSLPGYTASPWSCQGGTLSGAVLTLAGGDTATCTITNDDVSPRLKLIKKVVNDDGRTAEATDFTLSASGPTPVSGAGGADSDVDAGTYQLSETTLPGYTASGWVCTGTGTQSGAAITLALGQSATCTITNDDTPRVSDFSVSLAATPTIVKSGGVVTYTITVANNGPDNASAVLTDVIPSTMTFQGISPGQASCTTPVQGSSGTIVCALAPLASGTSTTVSVTLKVGPVRRTTITNTVTVAPTGGATDPTSANNTAAITVRVR